MKKLLVLGMLLIAGCKTPMTQMQKLLSGAFERSVLTQQAANRVPSAFLHIGEYVVFSLTSPDACIWTPITSDVGEYIGHHFVPADGFWDPHDPDYGAGQDQFAFRLPVRPGVHNMRFDLFCFDEYKDGVEFQIVVLDDRSDTK